MRTARIETVGVSTARLSEVAFYGQESRGQGTGLIAAAKAGITVDIHDAGATCHDQPAGIDGR